MPGQAAQVGVHGVDRFHPRREAGAVDGFLDLARGGIEPVPVFVHQDHDAGVVALRHQAAVDLCDGRLRIGHHRQRILVHGASAGVEYLVEEAAYLLPPLLAELVEVPDRFVGVHEDEARRPAVLACQFAQRGEDAGRGLQRKALDGDRLDEFAADAGNDAAEQFLATDDGIQVHGIAGQDDRMVKARDAELQPAQQRVVRGAAAIFSNHLYAAQALERHARRQARFDAGALAAEEIDQALRARPVAGRVRFVVEHQFDKPALRQQRRKIGGAEDEVAFIHGAHAFEQAAALLVDGGGNRVREVGQARWRIAGRGPPHRVDVDHPAAAQPRQGLVDAEGDQFALFFRAAGVVPATVDPGRHEGAVLADDDAIVDHGGIVQQVGQPGSARAVLFQAHAGASRADARVQDGQHQAAARRHGDGNRLGHLYCLPWLPVLTRNGVLRAA